MSLRWIGWWDQSQYLAIARAIASCSLSASNFLYGAGFPALAAPFLLIPGLKPWIYCFVVTWTNAVTAATSAVLLLFAIERHLIKRGTLALSGLLLGWTFSARYVDAGFCGILALSLPSYRLWIVPLSLDPVRCSPIFMGHHRLNRRGELDGRIFRPCRGK